MREQHKEKVDLAHNPKLYSSLSQGNQSGKMLKQLEVHIFTQETAAMD